MVGSRGSDRLTVIAAGVIHILSLAHTLCNLSLLSVSAFHGRYGGFLIILTSWQVTLDSKSA